MTDDMFVHIWDLAQRGCNLCCVTYNTNNNFNPIFSIYFFLYNHTSLKSCCKNIDSDKQRLHFASRSSSFTACGCQSDI